MTDIEMKEMVVYHQIKDAAERIHPDSEDNCNDSFLSWNGVAQCERDAFTEGALLQLEHDNAIALKCYCRAKCPHHAEDDSERCRQNGKCQDYDNFEMVLARDNMTCPNVIKMLAEHNFRLGDVKK